MSAIGRTRLSLSLEAVIFGAVALNLIYLVFFGSIWIIAMMILFFSYESTLSEGTLWILAAFLASIVGVYTVGMWAVRGFLEMRRLPIYAATSILLLYSGESIFVRRFDGYVVLAVTVFAIGVALYSRGLSFWIRGNNNP